MGSQLSAKGAQQPPLPLFDPCLFWPWSPISATAELLSQDSLIIIINDNVYGAILMTMVTARVHPVHLMNADWAPGGRQPSDQANRIDKVIAMVRVAPFFDSRCRSVWEGTVLRGKRPPTLKYRDTAAICAKAAEPIEIPFDCELGCAQGVMC